MSQTHFTTGNATSGLDRELLSRLTWPEVASFTGVRRVMILNDLEKFDIRPQVRVRPEVLSKFRRGAKSLMVHLGAVGGEVAFDGEWRNLRAGEACLLDHRRREEAGLGGGDQEMREINDGYGGKSFAPFTTTSYPDLFEFRMPGEAQLVAAVS